MMSSGEMEQQVWPHWN